MYKEYRPALHFTPSVGWINDPNGLIWDGAKYHLFAQHNPDAIVWGPMHWLHATSTDMLHWKEQGIALYPDELGTIFSGSAAMMDDGQIALMYTSHGDKERQSVAFTRDGEHFEKYAGNPVIENPGLRDFRDPKLFWNGPRKCWGMVLAAQDHLDFYASANMTDWEKTGEFRAVAGEKIIYECPDLFFEKAPDGREVAVLTASLIFLGREEKGCKMRYFLGEFDGNTFVERFPSDQPLRMDVGYDSYAGVNFANLSETIWMNWMSGVSSPLPMKEYCGCMSLPRKARLVETAQGLRLAQTPVLPETSWQPVESGVRPESQTFAVRVRAEGEFELALCGQDGQQVLRIGLDGENNLYTCRAKSELFADKSAYNEDARRSTSVPRLRTGAVELMVVCDAYCVEIFADDGLYFHGLLAFANDGFEKIDFSGAAAEYAAIQ